MEETIVCLYNTDKKELIGIFKSLAIAKRYIFNEDSKWNNNRIFNAYAKRSRLHKNIIFDFPVAVRMARENHVALLGEKEIYISDGYPGIGKRKISGVLSCKFKN
jgi:hypothetical protein